MNPIAPPSQTVNARQAALSRELSTVSSLGGVVIMLLTIVSLHDDVSTMLYLALVQMPIVTLLNVVITRLEHRRMRPHTGEILRLLVNLVGVLLVSHLAHWPLVIWFMQPLIAVSSENFGRRIADVSVAAFALGQGALALIDGQPLGYPIAASALAIVMAWISRKRSATIVDMLVESDQQRAALEVAHAETRAALDRIQQEIEAREAMEIELRQAQKLEAVGRLAAGIAHEINTPIQFVGDSTRFVKEAVADLMALIATYREGQRLIAEGASPEEMRRRMADAEDGADLPYLREHIPIAVERSLEGLQRVTNIVRSMKEFAHPDALVMAEADLDHAIASTLTIAHFEYKQVADAVLDLGGLPRITCHLGEVNQVVLNLVVNAAHAIADRVAGTTERGRITVRTRHADGWVSIAISDTGTGIPAAIRERIFEPFFTTKEVGRGTGQGLTLARAVVNRHGGRIELASELGVGTTFTIHLPVRPQPVELAA